jgi:hypothetical protein
VKRPLVLSPTIIVCALGAGAFLGFGHYDAVAFIGLAAFAAFLSLWNDRDRMLQAHYELWWRSPSRHFSRRTALLIGLGPLFLAAFIVALALQAVTYWPVRLVHPISN